MNILNGLVFYEFKKRPKRKKKPKIWIRKITKSTQFNEKVRVIRERAAIINSKLEKLTA